MGTKIGKEKILREKGYLYFIGKDGYVWAAPMKHNKTGKKKNYFYFAAAKFNRVLPIVRARSEASSSIAMAIANGVADHSGVVPPMYQVSGSSWLIRACPI